MAIVKTSEIDVKPNEVTVRLEADNGPVTLQFSVFGAAQFARDMSIAATRATKLGQLRPSESAPGLEVLVASRATMEEYGEDTATGDVLLRLRDEQGVLHIFRLDPNEVTEFAQHALLHAQDQSSSH
jgi:hypothetical protein